MTQRAGWPPAQADSVLLGVRARVGEPLRLDVDVAVTAPGVVGVVGPNAAGKSTLLRTIAGLEQVDRDSSVVIDGVDVTSLEPSRRRVAFVPQHGALFPHLSVRDNVGYGVRAAGARRSVARERASEQLDVLGLADLADRAPATLSGGQRQRVAIARALAVEPKVVLLDEPTTALDATSRTEVRAVLREQLASFPGVTVLVTHNASEVLTLASRVLVMSDGLLVQDASPDDLVLRPGSPWLAEMLSMNAWQGTVTEPSVIALDGGGQLQGVDLPAPGSRLLVTTSPTAVGLFSARPAGSVRNVWQARVEDVVVLGDRVRVTLIAQQSGPHRTVAEITSAAAAELGVRAGSRHFVALKATELAISPL